MVKLPRKLTTATLSSHHIKWLRDEAERYGDRELVDTCDAAMSGGARGSGSRDVGRARKVVVGEINRLVGHAVRSGGTAGPTRESTREPRSKSEIEREIDADVSGGHGRDAADQPAGGFDEAFLDAFHRIDARSGGHNYVLLYDLREALSDLGVGREAFDSGVNQLRRRRIASLDSADGRHVRLSKEQMGAAIREGDSILVYAALRR